MYNLPVKYTFRKAEVYYFVRKIPVDLRERYRTGRISFSLRTRSPKVAADRARRVAARLDDYWFQMRVSSDVPGAHLLRDAPAQPVPEVAAPKTAQVIEEANPTLSEAVALYKRLKGAGKPETFLRAPERVAEYLREAVGEKRLLDYTRADANKFRDWLLARGIAGSSIARTIGTLRAVLNFAASEHALDFRNPFQGVQFDATAGVADREPVPLPIVRKVQAACRAADDDLRWLVALISDTGLRLSEAAGLARADIVLNHPIPHLKITPHPWRSLKTASSKRLVPLVGASRWAAERIMATPSASPYAFPRYVSAGKTNANSASAALNKWHATLAPSGTLHGYRHALRDRLRAVSCPSDVTDQIGGWTTPGVGQSYGAGYPLKVLEKWMKAIE